MASISTDKNGLRKIQFLDDGGNRKTIYLGNMTMKIANEIKLKVEMLRTAKVTRNSIDNETANWVANIGDELAEKLAAVGLIPERAKRKVTTLAGLIAHVVELRSDAKPRTLTNLKQAAAKLVEHFGAEKPLERITEGDADSFVAAMRKKYSPAYVSRLTKYGKQFFHAARRAGLVTANPFDGVKAGTMANPERMYFLTRADTQKIIDACPSAEWRLIVALARFGGLRCPSELATLTWDDINWDQGRFLVKSPKTAHHADGGRRWVPLFPELRPYLDEMFDQAEEKSVYVFRRTLTHETNLRTSFERIIYRAGLIPWPKLFQNLRATRETELVQSFPLHVVTSWIGNSARVAAKHYLQVTDEDYLKAISGSAQTTQNPTHETTQRGIVGGSREMSGIPQTITPREFSLSETTRDNYCTSVQYARQESNNNTIPLVNSQISPTDDVKSDAVGESGQNAAVLLLSKLAVGLTDMERAALIKLLSGQ